MLCTGRTSPNKPQTLPVGQTAAGPLANCHQNRSKPALPRGATNRAIEITAAPRQIKLCKGSCSSHTRRDDTYAVLFACPDHTEGRAATSAHGGEVQPDWALCGHVHRSARGPRGQLGLRALSAPRSVAVGLRVCRAGQSARDPVTWPWVSSTALPARQCHMAWQGGSPRSPQGQVGQSLRLPRFR